MIKELKERRARIWSQMREVVEEAKRANRAPDAEERQKYDRMEAEVAELDAQIDLLERDADVASRLAIVQAQSADQLKGLDKDTRTAAEKHTAVYAKFLRDGVSEMDAEERKTLMLHSDSELGKELRAQGIATGPAGGFLVPTEYWARIAEVMKTFGTIIPFVNNITTNSGADLPWPTNDDTANEGVIVGENTQIGEQDLTWDQRTIGAHMYTSKIVRVSLQLLQDSGFDTEGFIARKLGERLGRVINRHLTVGTGTGQPLGLVTATPVALRLATNGVVNYKQLIDLIHSIDPAYRGQARLMFNDVFLAALRKVEDTAGRPIWAPSLTEGAPSTVLGVPYTVNQFMSDKLTTTGAAGTVGDKLAIYGDFNSAYVHRTVRGLSMVRFAEKYMDFLQIGFMGFERHDGAPDELSAVAVLGGTNL